MSRANLADFPQCLLDRLAKPKHPPKQSPPPTTTSLHNGSGTATPYGLAALESEAKKVADTPPGSRNAALNTAALKLGRLLGGREL